MLGQLDSQNRERVIAYGGRALRPAEQKWDISDRESLALIEVIKAYHVYLANKTVTVYTDSMAVRWLKETPVTTLTGRRARWAVFMQMYDYTRKDQRIQMLML